MLSVLFKIPFFKLFRKFGLPGMLPISYTVSLTYKCNSRCRTCNIYSRNSEELSVEEYERVFLSIGKSPHWITFSGGEPFLRRDIADICIKAYELCSPQIINIPTNGILSDKIVKDVKHILDICTDTNVIINLSIDAIGDKHDEIRGFKGAFERVMETYYSLKAIKKDNLTVGIHTVISKFNAKDIPDIYKQLKKLEPDSYITEIAEQRAELCTLDADITPMRAAYSEAVDFITEDMRLWKMKGISRITRAFRTQYYKHVKDILREKRMFIPCFAGVASCQIAPDGEVWACCIKSEVLGNLRDAEFDFRKIWFSEKAAEVRWAIKKRNCFCPLANTGYTNMLFSFKTLSKVVKEIALL